MNAPNEKVHFLNVTQLAHHKFPEKTNTRFGNFYVLGRVYELETYFVRQVPRYGGNGPNDANPGEMYLQFVHTA